MKQLYLCGNFNDKEKFLEAEISLTRDNKYFIFNPANCGVFANGSKKAILRNMLDCDGVALVDGWETNKEAGEQVDIAIKTNMPIRSVAMWLNDIPDSNLGDEVMSIHLILPEADINGLHFNEQKTDAIFDKKNDGLYHSRHVIFLSSRNVVNYNGMDCLSEYLQSEIVKKAFADKIYPLFDIDDDDMSMTISLPEEDEGVKTYNGGGSCIYWLKGKYIQTEENFFVAPSMGITNWYAASAVAGCSPIIKIN